MTALQLREVARAEKLPITYVTQRRRAALAQLIEDALRERG